MKELYTAGLHILAEIECENGSALRDSDQIRIFIDREIDKHGLHKLGEVYHSFPGAGYTAVVCLTESHIAIHTWPEFSRVTFDVFLSNHNHMNDNKAEQIANDLATLFMPVSIHKTILRR